MQGEASQKYDCTLVLNQQVKEATPTHFAISMHVRALIWNSINITSTGEE